MPIDKSFESNWALYSPFDCEVLICKRTFGTYKGNYGAFGNYIVLKGDEYNILFAHLAYKPSFSSGDRLFKGQFIGIVGSTGNVTGRHLHVEVSHCSLLSDNWYSKHSSNLVRPSDVISFSSSDVSDPVLLWKNGSTKERVYPSVELCNSQGNGAIGSLYPYESCVCYGMLKGCYIISYQVGSSSNYKIGLVKYHGGLSG